MKKFIVIFALFCFSSTQAAVEVVFFDKTGLEGSFVYNQVQLLSKFYGITSIDLPGEKASAAFLQAHLQDKSNRVLAVIINAEVLDTLDNQQTLKVLKELAPEIPVLITGVRANTPLEALQIWTGTLVSGVADQRDFSGHYFVHKHGITKQLAEQRVAWKSADISWLQVAPQAPANIIIQLENNSVQPLFIETQQQGLKVFVAGFVQPEAFIGEKIWRLNPQRFLQIAPLMLVMQTTCGDYCWHMPKPVANLTIDDPWLTEPYGPLHFQGLLAEMQKAKFHTTIGFIPWNYDRSEPEAINVFKENPRYFSLCMHGNNHDHREFYKYVTTEADPWPAKALEAQDFNLRQGLARLEKLHALTGLSYDRVMVFPHNIAPEGTLELMKKYNFLATVNGGNIPLDSPEPTDPLFYFRTVSTQFANFPSLDRTEPQSYKPARIALDLYLGNPVLFFEHVLFFADGMDAFNATAEYVNHLQPDMHWTHLADVAQHLYVQRKVAENRYEIDAFSRKIKVYNPTQQNAEFIVYKTIVPGEEITSIRLEDNLQSYNYQPGDKQLSMAFSIPPGESRVLELKYANTLDLTGIELEKPDAQINRLRWMSDFRDITVSGTWLGRKFTQWYYGSDSYKGGVKQLLLFAVILLLIFVLLLWWLIRFIRSRLHAVA